MRVLFTSSRLNDRAPHEYDMRFEINRFDLLVHWFTVTGSWFTGSFTGWLKESVPHEDDI